jgi:hypothetical protein
LLSKSAEREQGTELRRRPSPTLLPRETRDEAHVPLVVRGFHSCGGGGQGRSGPSDERGGRRALRAGVGLGGGRAETAVGPTRRDLACRWVRAGGAARGDVSCRDEEAARPSLVWAAIIVGMGPTHWLRFLTNQRFKAGPTAPGFFESTTRDGGSSPLASCHQATSPSATLRVFTASI